MTALLERVIYHLSEHKRDAALLQQVTQSGQLVQGVTRHYPESPAHPRWLIKARPATQSNRDEIWIDGMFFYIDTANNLIMGGRVC